MGDLGEDVLGELGEYELSAVQYVYGKGRVAARELANYLARSVIVSRPVLKSLVERGFSAGTATALTTRLNTIPFTGPSRFE